MTALGAERREQLLAMLRRDGVVRVADVSEALGVTPVTVRRDIAALADEGLLRRVHGGAATVRDDAAAAPADAPGPTLGMVVPSLDYYYPSVIRGARAAAEERGARIVLRGSSYTAQDDRQELARLVGSVGIDGLLVAPTVTGTEGEDTVRWLQSLDVPVVLIERTATMPPLKGYMESVLSDHALGAAEAVRHLASLGHRRVGLCLTAASPTAPHVRRGWLTACEELGLPVEGTPNLDTDNYASPQWPGTADALLDACLASRTTAVLVHSDPEAIALVERCHARGLRVPADLSVVAYDDEVAALAEPPLTAVRPHRQAIGRAAVELLLARLADPRRPMHRVVVSPELMTRGSTAALTAPDRR